MNKLYSIHCYIKGHYYCEMSTFHKDEIAADLAKYPEAYLIEDNEIHTIWRLDLI